MSDENETVQPVGNLTVLAGEAICPHCRKPVVRGEKFLRTGVHVLAANDHGTLEDVTVGWMVTHFDCCLRKGTI